MRFAAVFAVLPVLAAAQAGMSRRDASATAVLAPQSAQDICPGLIGEFCPLLPVPTPTYAIR